MFRRYNRWQSRFDQPDPYDGSYSLANPQSFNRYAHVHGDPVNFVDPTGTMCQLVDSLTGPGEHAPTYYLWACTRPDNFSGFTGGGGGGGGGGDKGDRPPTNPEGREIQIALRTPLQEEGLGTQETSFQVLTAAMRIAVSMWKRVPESIQ